MALPWTVTHIGVHHVHGRVDVVLHEQLTGMGERLADISVVGEDLEVGVYPDMPMGRTTLVVACSTLPQISYFKVSMRNGKIFQSLSWTRLGRWTGTRRSRSDQRSEHPVAKSLRRGLEGKQLIAKVGEERGLSSRQLVLKRPVLERS